MVIRKKRRHKGFGRFLLLLLALALLVLDSRFRIVKNEYKLHYTDLPAQFDGLRIVQISDLHCASFGRDNEKLLAKVRKAEPDIIAVTGDIIDRDGEEDYARELFTALAEIAPSYYVTGNHEWSLDDTDAMLELIRSCGVRVLQNQYVLLERGGGYIALVGLDDPCGRADMEKPEEVMARLRAEQGDIFTVMLYHRNRPPEELYNLGADLIFSGHAHGGLIRLPFTDGLMDASRTWFPKYTSGVYEHEGMKLVVSRGLGNSVIVPRFLNNPHLPVAVLVKD